MAILATILLLSSAVLSLSSPAKRTCPLDKDIVPCKCTGQSKGGVKLICEKTDMTTINKTLRHMVPMEQTIVYLKLRQSNVGHLPDNIFQGLTVKHLIISNSSVTSVGPAAFAGLEGSVEIMDLSQNKLREIPVQALKLLRGLLGISLNHNDFEEVPAHAFQGLTALAQLSLNSNRIKSIDPAAFDGVAGSLTQLNLANNQLTAIPTNALKKLHHLERLELKENNISSIGKDHFQGLHKLDTVDLDSNKIKEIPSQVFGNQTVINSAGFETNLIEHIADDAFVGVEGTLEWLRLGENRLNQIPSTAVHRLSKLRQLDLKHNNISTIADDAFDGFGSSLKFLGLQRNNIQRVPTTIFSTMHTLQWLYLSDNQLRRLPMETYEPVIDTLINMDVHGNPLICDCDLLWFRNWIPADGKKVLTFPHNTQCNEPAALRKEPVANVDPDYFTCPMRDSASGADRHLISFITLALFLWLQSFWN